MRRDKIKRMAKELAATGAQRMDQTRGIALWFVPTEGKKVGRLVWAIEVPTAASTFVVPPYGAGRGRRSSWYTVAGKDLPCLLYDEMLRLPIDVNDDASAPSIVGTNKP